MKVGVVLDEYVPQDGGAFTLQGEILDSLVSLCGESQHQFVVISEARQISQQQLKSGGMDWLPLKQPGLIEKVLAFFARNWPNLRARLDWRSGFERRAREAGIEFLWFLGQRTQDVDLPFMTIVFDLQHRAQPWFPEVSQLGQWDTRERAFARYLRRASAIISGTQAGKDEIVRFYQIPPDRIRILPHPTPGYALNLKKNNSANSLPPFGLEKKGYLFYPAQFWAHKNHVNLLLAIKNLKEEGVRIPLVLAGSDFGNRDYVEKQILGLGLTDQVKVVGFVDQADLIALYQNALALTYLSFFGPENLPPLEAFAIGCPVIAARVSGAEEQLGESALLVNPADPQEIASTIRQILEDQELREKLVASGQKKAQSWTAPDFVRGAFKILDGFAPIRRTWN